MANWRLIRALQGTEETEGKADRTPYPPNHTPSPEAKHGLCLTFRHCLVTSLAWVAQEPGLQV